MASNSGLHVLTKNNNFIICSMLFDVTVHPRACPPVLWSCDWPSYIPLGWEARLTALQPASPFQRANRWVNPGFDIYGTWPQACAKFIENSSAQTRNLQNKRSTKHCYWHRSIEMSYFHQGLELFTIYTQSLYCGWNLAHYSMFSNTPINIP